jgi:hypothetical protein
MRELPSRKVSSPKKQPGTEIQQRYERQQNFKQDQPQQGVQNGQPRSSIPIPKPTFRGLSKELGVSSSQGLVLQPKLTMGKPNDRYEQEADKSAAEIVQQINAPRGKQDIVQRELEVSPQPNLLTRMPLQGMNAAQVEVSPRLEASIQRQKGDGQPLDANLQKSIGQAMGADFCGVRVHANATADQLNRSISATAFTTGSDVFFRQGAYQPKTRAGQELIAHELTHVVQQGASGKGANYIQRTIYYKLDSEGEPEKWAGTAEALFTELDDWVKTSAPEELKTEWSNQGRKTIIGIVKDMMADRWKSTLYVKEALHFSTALERKKQIFINEENAVRKILAETYREEATQKEGELAQQLMDGKIVEYLQQVAKKIQAWPLYKKYKEAMEGEYTHYMKKRWYKGGKVKKIDEVLGGSNDFKKLISAIHDITSSLFHFQIDPIGLMELKKDVNALEDEIKRLVIAWDKKNAKGKNKERDEIGVQLNKKQAERDELRKLIQDAEDDEALAHAAVEASDDKSVSTYSYESSLNPTDWKTEKIEQVRPKVGKKGFSYIDETSNVMKQARKNKMLVEVGPSFTTARLMQLCTTIGCTDDEKISVALAIFAFWNKDYWKSSSGIHRLHFVMDMCKNYVPSLNYNTAYPKHLKELAPFLFE